MSRVIIFIGSNSSLVQTIIKKKKNIYRYSKIYLLCHRKYKGKKENYIIIENISPIDIINCLKEIILSNSEKNLIDILVTNTPPQTSDFDDEKTKEWGLASLKLFNYFGFSKKINKAIFIGSSLSFVPFLRSGIYKSIKKIEFLIYYELYYNSTLNLSFCLLPPLSPGINGFGKYFSQSKIYWAQKIMNEFNTETKFILPNGLVGLILKLIFFIKMIKI